MKAYSGLFLLQKVIKQLRRERVKYFYENDLVSKGGPKKEETK